MNKKLILLLLILLMGPAILAFTQTPAAELPPRPPPATSTLGAQIALVLPAGAVPSPGWWSVVQWQDDRGRWHDVDGWQGTFDPATGRVVWWVGPEHLGRGPFRWLVYDTAEQHREVGHSAPFQMPDRHLAVLEIALMLPAAD